MAQIIPWIGADLALRSVGLVARRMSTCRFKVRSRPLPNDSDVEV